MHIKRKEIVQCDGLQNAAVQNKFKKVSNKQTGVVIFLLVRNRVKITRGVEMYGRSSEKISRSRP